MTTPSASPPDAVHPEPLPDDFLQALRAWQTSRILLTALELDLFTAIGAGVTSAEVAARLRADARGVDLLLNAVAGLGLLEKRGDIFQNGPVAARLLCAGAEHDQRAGLMHTATLWHGWSHLTECVRTGAPAPRATPGPAAAEEFIAAMEMNAQGRAPHVVAAVAPAGARRLLDVGGGSGAYAIAFARAVPELAAVVFDLPDVLPITERHIRAAGLAARITLMPGDLTRDDLGAGFDLVLLSAVCHMNGPDANADLVRRAARALNPGGRLIIHDHLLAPARTTPLSGAVFALNMLVNTAAGQSYTAEEYSAWLRAAGLTAVERRALPGPTGLVIGTRA